MPIKVNQSVISDAALEQEMQRLRMYMPQSDPEQLRSVVTDQMIERELLRQVAARSPEKISEGQVQQRLQAMQKKAGGRKKLLKDLGLKASQQDVLHSRVVADLKFEKLMIQLRDQPEPTATDVETYYRENAGAFMTEQEVDASHIVLHIDEKQDEATARERMTKAEEALAAGTPFAEVADTLSDCAGHGGALGRFPRGQMVEEFEAVVFALAPGAVSGVFKTAFGLHIAMVHAQYPARLKPLDEVRQQVHQQCQDRQRRAAIDRVLGDARERATIARI